MTSAGIPAWAMWPSYFAAAASTIGATFTGSPELSLALSLGRVVVVSPLLGGCTVGCSVLDVLLSGVLGDDHHHRRGRGRGGRLATRRCLCVSFCLCFTCQWGYHVPCDTWQHSSPFLSTLFVAKRARTDAVRWRLGGLWVFLQILKGHYVVFKLCVVYLGFGAFLLSFSLRVCTFQLFPCDSLLSFLSLSFHHTSICFFNRL